MALRRTEIARKTELRRITPMPRSGMRDRKVRKIKPASDTGPTAAQRRVVHVRANWCCEVCGRSLYLVDVGWHTPHSIHHRRPRAMGGSTAVDTNLPSNLLLLCGTGTTGCHGLIEADRATALSGGLLVPQGGSPASVVALLHRGPTLLADDGTYQDAA